MTQTETILLTEKEKMLSELEYDPFDEELTQLRNEAKIKIYELNNKLTPFETEKRKQLLKSILGTYHDTNIESPFRCDYGFNIHLGENVFMNFDCVLLDINEIIIGDNTLIGPGVHFYTATHPLDPVERRTKKLMGKPIHIGNDCWIGGKVIICPGVKIGSSVTVAAGSIVTKDIPDFVMVAGVPVYKTS